MDELKAGAAGLGLRLSPGQIQQFEVYYRELVAWNQRVNLTGITGYEAVQVAHFLDHAECVGIAAGVVLTTGALVLAGASRAVASTDLAQRGPHAAELDLPAGRR